MGVGERAPWFAPEGSTDSATETLRGAIPEFPASDPDSCSAASGTEPTASSPPCSCCPGAWLRWGAPSVSPPPTLNLTSSPPAAPLCSLPSCLYPAPPASSSSPLSLGLAPGAPGTQLPLALGAGPPGPELSLALALAPRVSVGEEMGGSGGGPALRKRMAWGWRRLGVGGEVGGARLFWAHHVATMALSAMLGMVARECSGRSLAGHTRRP